MLHRNYTSFERMGSDNEVAKWKFCNDNMGT